MKPSCGEPSLNTTLEQLEAYLVDEFDIFVDYDAYGSDEFWYKDDTQSGGTITINSQHSLAEQVNILAHEAGHVVLRSDEKHHLTFPDQDTTTQVGRLEILREEVMAWEIGRHLLESQNLFYESESWKQSYRNAPTNYIQYVIS